MPKAPLRAATVGGSADDIEASFYEALQKGDIEQLMACWADEDEIVQAMVGREIQDVFGGGRKMCGSGSGCGRP